jgi:hypothetical protein
MARALRETAASVTFQSHWLKLFPEVPIPGSDRRSLLDLTSDFMHLVDDSLFPIDWRILDDCYNVEGDVMEVVNFLIPFAGWGIEYQESSFEDIEPWAQPLVALLTSSDGGYDWWASALIDEPNVHELEWHLCAESAIARLDELEPPLDGLSVAYKCVWKESGNPFFDCVDTFWRGYYWDDDHTWWYLKDIVHLGQCYAQAKPEVEKLKAYIDWYDETPGAHQVVAGIFIDLEDSEDETTMWPGMPYGPGDGA